MKALYRGAQAGLTIARLLTTAFYFAVAILLIGFALWLAWPFGRNWFLTCIAAVVGLQGAATGMKALEIFLSTRPPERTAQGQERPRSSRRNQDRPA
jgi:hypothetical protein